MRNPIFFLSLTASSISIAAVWPAQADDIARLPAVSSLNGKVEFSGGPTEDFSDADKERYHAAASVTAPISKALGAQLDGAIGDYRGETTGGAGLHLFTRDPKIGLLGVNGEYIAIGSDDVFRVGPEAELYLGQLTLQTWGGFESSDFVDEEAFVQAKASYYITDNLKISAGYNHYLDLDSATVGVEWQPTHWAGRNNVTLFAEAETGSDQDSILGGVKIYLGDNKSLIDRHRQDDPDNQLTSMLALLKKGRVPIAPAGPLGPRK